MWKKFYLSAIVLIVCVFVIISASLLIAETIRWIVGEISVLF